MLLFLFFILAFIGRCPAMLLLANTFAFPAQAGSGAMR